MARDLTAGGPVQLKTLLAEGPAVKSIFSGAVKSDLLTLDLSGPKVAHDGFKGMIRRGEYDCGELAIVSFLQAKYYGKPLVLMPATINGRFQHHCIACNTERGLLRPEDLKGKRIGVRSYTQTTGAWVRGILQNEYGVDLDSNEWIVFEEPHVEEYSYPDNVHYGPTDKKLVAMLLDGELDAAMLGGSMPDDSRLQTVVPNPKEAALEWYEKTGVRPMNHMVVVSEELSQTRPDVVGELYRMLKESRDLDTTPTNGIQFRQYGYDNLCQSLEMIIFYAHQQGLIGRRLRVDELFDDTTRALKD